MFTESSVVAVYQTHTEADRAVKDLQRDGVDMRKLSLSSAKATTQMSSS
jgi:hypothetical protein